MMASSGQGSRSVSAYQQAVAGKVGLTVIAKRKRRSRSL